MTDAEEDLRRLEEECASSCREWDWMGPTGTPNYRLIYSNPSTFVKHAAFMLLAMFPRGASSLADAHPPELPYDRGDYSAFLDEQWSKTAAGTERTQEAAQLVTAAFVRDPRAARGLLRRSPSGNMIPFRARGIGELPLELKNRGIALGQALIRLVQPRAVVLLSSDRVLFSSAVAACDGTITESLTQTYDGNQTYRDALVEAGATHMAFFGLPQRALAKALADLSRRVNELGIGRLA